jgi:hypothetical protein
MKIANTLANTLFIILGDRGIIFNMRMFIQPFKLIISTVFIGISLLSAPVRADGGEDYYKGLRKMKSFDPAALEELKKNTVDAEQIKKVNELSRANAAHNAKIDAKKKISPTADAPIAERSSKSGKKPTPAVVTSAPAKPSKRKDTSSSSSAPVKVDSETPDELSFPGPSDDENKKGAN